MDWIAAVAARIADIRLTYTFTTDPRATLIGVVYSVLQLAQYYAGHTKAFQGLRNTTIDADHMDDRPYLFMCDPVLIAPLQWISHSCILPKAPIIDRFIMDRVLKWL